MPPARFEFAIPASKRPPTQAIVDTGITKVGSSQKKSCEFSFVMVKTGRPYNEQISIHKFVFLDTYHSDIRVYCQRLLFHNGQFMINITSNLQFLYSRRRRPVHTKLKFGQHTYLEFITQLTVTEDYLGLKNSAKFHQ